MKLEHIAIWTKQLEVMKEFYEKYFHGKANELYHNKDKAFKSYFITFESGARLELMTRPDLLDKLSTSDNHQYLGYNHLAFEVESVSRVNELAFSFKEQGIPILNGPRKTDDGYYEFILLDPDLNYIEIICR